MTLREQVRELGSRTFSKGHLLRMQSWPELLQALAVIAFHHSWDKQEEREKDCRVVRVALGLLETGGMVKSDEPGVR